MGTNALCMSSHAATSATGDSHSARANAHAAVKQPCPLRFSEATRTAAAGLDHRLTPASRSRAPCQDWQSRPSAGDAGHHAHRLITQPGVGPQERPLGLAGTASERSPPTWRPRRRTIPAKRLSQSWRPLNSFLRRPLRNDAPHGGNNPAMPPTRTTETRLPFAVASVAGNSSIFEASFPW